MDTEFLVTNLQKREMAKTVWPGQASTLADSLLGMTRGVAVLLRMAKVSLRQALRS